ncbi:MAG: hypothetical protein HY080_15025 [Gammaproteobacteria bacterium]|nr:hypothetical protein [Gammaproteobacteria bacterium]
MSLSTFYRQTYAYKILVCCCLVILSSLGHAAEAVQNTPAVRFVGSFSNYHYTQEHQYGSQIVLWQYKNTVVGLFYQAEGLAGDTPRGMIENVQLQPRSGRLTFQAKLTTGIHSCKVHNNVPSQDLFVFSGVLRRATLTGTLRHRDMLHEENKDRDIKVSLRHDLQAPYQSFNSLDAWQQHYAEELKQYGPKW